MTITSLFPIILLVRRGSSGLTGRVPPWLARGTLRGVRLRRAWMLVRLVALGVACQACTRAAESDPGEREALEVELARLRAEHARLLAQEATLKRELAAPGVRAQPIRVDVPWLRNDTPYPRATAPVPVDPSRRDPRDALEQTKVEPYRR